MILNDSRRQVPAAAEADDLQFLRVADVCALLRISRPTLWRLRRAKEFPAPTWLSRRSIGWLRKDIASWARTRSESPLDAVAVPASSRAMASTTVSPRKSAVVSESSRRKRSQLSLSLPRSS